MSKIASKTLSCFVDESGDFGDFQPHCPFYLVSIVLHDQANSIHGSIIRLEHLLSQSGFSHHTLHAGPLLRREKPYHDDTIECRRRLFNYLLNFARQIPIRLLSIEVRKSDCSNYEDLVKKLNQKIKQEIERTKQYWESSTKSFCIMIMGKKP